MRAAHPLKVNLQNLGLQLEIFKRWILPHLPHHCGVAPLGWDMLAAVQYVWQLTYSL